MSESNAQPTSAKTQKWGEKEKAEWLAEQKIQRSYADDVITKIEKLKPSLEVTQYATLTYAQKQYPLFSVKTRNWDDAKPTILITGGVHGYETSGVHGALRFLEAKIFDYTEHFNFIVAPCISPWGYETINRWNPNAIDPNRSFYQDTPAQESANIMQHVASLQTPILAHIDLHETTDTDNTTFRPALAARDGVTHTNWNIPDGFYCVGDTENPTPAFQKAIIDSVRKVTHIAPADNDGKIIGETLAQEGVINYAIKKLSLCASLTNAKYVTTTEVYPDSPKVNDEDCVIAQVAAITGGLDYLIKNK